MDEQPDEQTVGTRKHHPGVHPSEHELGNRSLMELNVLDLARDIGWDYEASSANYLCPEHPKTAESYPNVPEHGKLHLVRRRLYCLLRTR